MPHRYCMDWDRKKFAADDALRAFRMTSSLFETFCRRSAS